MNTSKQIKFGALLSYASIAINILSGLLYTPWMVNQIGQNDYGLYTLANSVITLLMVDFGLSSATARYLSKYNAEGKHEEAERFLGAVYKLYLIVDAVILTALVVIYFRIDTIYATLTPDELSRFKVVYIISALFSVVNFPFITFNGILTSHEKFVPLKLADVIYRVCLVGFTIIALLMGYGLYALVTVHAIVGWSVTLYKFIVIKKTVPLKVKFRNTDKSLYKDIFGFSLWTTISSLMQRLVFNITPSILGMVTGAAQIAVFGIVTTIEGYSYTITTAINGMFMPRISRLVANDKSNEALNKLLVDVGKFQFTINGLIIAGFAVVGKSFISLWMGEAYLDAYYGILLVVIPGAFFNSMQIANTTVVVEGKVKLMAIVNILTGVINVCLSYPLSKSYGVLGACVSICIAYSVRSIVLMVLYNKVLPFNIPRFIRQCYLKLSVPIVLTILIGFAMNQVVPDSGWLVLIVKGGFTAVVFGGLVFTMGFSKDERNALLGRVTGLIKKH
ncbi:MAG: oligosaccharide flippase family protein [Clostridia bacterium]|nr:oligosaccharide flippase family protein [Clostridia bacterium]